MNSTIDHTNNRAAFQTMISDAINRPSRPVQFPITIHGTFVSFARDGNTVTNFKHKTGGTFNDWSAAQDALDSADQRKPSEITAGGFTSYYLIDANGRALEARRDGWTLSAAGVSVAKCTCGVWGSADMDCCDTESNCPL